MAKIKLRNQRVSDAKKFYEILNNPNFFYLDIKPKSIEDEKEWLRKNATKRKNNFEYNYTILYNNKIVGGCGIKINQHRKYIGEIGYFLDEKYWNKGIVTKAVLELEKIAFNKLKLIRIEIIMTKKNKPSEKVAIKCSYKKEGIIRKVVELNNKYEDCYLYSKVK
ncbi:MAG: GNAT family N-acetyltransferase [Candidatus Woesearchaeota archaeon]